MRLNLMKVFNTLNIVERKPKNRWDYQRIQPGNVGSVGDVNMTVRLKNSMPEARLKYDKSFYGKNEVFLGSNVQNGTSVAYCSGGSGPETYDSNWGNKSFKTSVGWIYQDMRAPDTFHEPRVGATPHYSWNNKIATAYEAKRTGSMFLPVPGPYMLHPSEVARGGATPRVVDVGDIEGEADDYIGKGVADLSKVKGTTPYHAINQPRYPNVLGISNPRRGPVVGKK